MILTACSDGADPPPTPAPVTTTVTDTSTPTPSPSAAPLLPDAARQPTRPGAEAFFRYFMAVYDHGYNTLDPEPLRSISGPSCTYCAAALSAIQDAKQRHLQFRGGGIVVRAALAAPGDAAAGLVMNAIVDQSPDEIIDSSGVVQGTEPGEVNQRIDAAVRWTHGHWLAIGVHVLTRDPSSS